MEKTFNKFSKEIVKHFLEKNQSKKSYKNQIIVIID